MYLNLLNIFQLYSEKRHSYVPSWYIIRLAYIYQRVLIALQYRLPYLCMSDCGSPNWYFSSQFGNY